MISELIKNAGKENRKIFSQVNEFCSVWKNFGECEKT